MSTKDEPIVCTATSDETRDQVWEWGDIQPKILRTEDLETGIALIFDADMAGAVSDLAVSEAECCKFMAFDSSSSNGEFRLEVTSENPEAAPIIAMLAGGVESSTV